MSRPRKFRVWDGEQMHEPPHSGFVLTSGGDIVFEPFESDLRELEDHVALFNTGLTDAEGNEVWEGDIVDWPDGRGDVYWHDDKACYLHGFVEKIDGGLGGVHRPPKAMFDRVRVIGNRYEDPELL